MGDVRGGVFVNQLRDKIAAMPHLQMAVCILPSAGDVYKAIKKTCYCEAGLPSQVVTSNILNMNNMVKTKSVITKVAIQMNCKLGGEIWGVTIPVRKYIFFVEIMNV